MNVRNLQPGEQWPEDCFLGYTPGMVYRDWCWIAEDNKGVPCAVLLTIPAHGVLLLLTIAASDGAPPSTINTLLKTAFAQAEQRGLIGYMVMTEPLTPEGQQILGIVRRAGGVQSINPVVLSYGVISEAIH